MHNPTESIVNTIVNSMSGYIGLLLLSVGIPVMFCALPMCCWWVRSKACNFRNCWCFKRVMRRTGVDKFNDFEFMMLIHEARHNNKGQMSTSMRVNAGGIVMDTDANTHSIFQQSFLVFAEQGTESVDVSLIDAFGREMAILKLDPVKDILEHTNGVSEKVFSMKANWQSVGAAQVVLTMKLERRKEATSAEEAKPLVGDVQSVQVEFLLREQLQKVGWREEVPAGRQVTELAKACLGPVDVFSSWGSTQVSTMSVSGPPDRRRWTLGLWSDRAALEKGEAGDVEVDVMRIAAVQADPGRSEVFVIFYVDNNRVQHELMLRRRDRSRDVWVELLKMLISTLRDLKQQRVLQSKSIRAKLGTEAKSASSGSGIGCTSSERARSHSERAPSHRHTTRAEPIGSQRSGSGSHLVPGSSGSGTQLGRTSSERRASRR